MEIKVSNEVLFSRISGIFEEVEKVYLQLAAAPVPNRSEFDRIHNPIKNKPLALKAIQRELNTRRISIPSQTQAQIEKTENWLNEIKLWRAAAQKTEAGQTITNLEPAMVSAAPGQFGSFGQTTNKGWQNNLRISQSPISSPNSWVVFLIAGIAVVIGASILIGISGNGIASYLIEGVLGLFLAVLIFFYPELGAYLLLITVLSNLSSIFISHDLPGINKPVVGLVLACVLANQILQTGRVSLLFKFTRVEWALVPYIAVILASVYVANAPSISLSAISSYAKNLIVLYCIFTTLNTAKKLRTGVWVAIIVTGVLSSFGVYQLITGNIQNTFGDLAMRSILNQMSSQGELRYGGPIGDANMWAQLLAAVLPLAIYRFFYEKKPFLRFIALLASLMIVTAIIYTYSRGAFVTLVLILAFIAWERRINFTRVMFAIGLGLLILFILPQSFRDRVVSIFDVFSAPSEFTVTTDESTAARITEMRVGLYMFQTHPFLGVGIGNYTNEYWSYAPDLGLDSGVLSTDVATSPRQPHDLFIEILAETGLLGLISFGIFIIVLLTNLWQAQKKAKNNSQSILIISIMMVILSWLIGGLFLHGVLTRWLWIFISLAIAGLHLPREDNEFESSLLKDRISENNIAPLA